MVKIILQRNSNMLFQVSQVNLNNMLCPAVSDPFHGRFYRLFAICHQLILIPSLGKLFVILARAFRILPCNNPPDVACLSEAFSYEAQQCCPKSTCSQDSTTATCARECFVSEDSGCGGESSCLLNSGHKNSRSKGVCCCICTPTCYTCSDRKCFLGPSIKDTKHCNRSYNSGIIHTQHIINGKLVGKDQNYRSNWTDGNSCCPGGARDTCSANKCYHQRTFLLNDLQDSSCESEVDKTLLVSDLEQSRSFHLKSQ